jgi:hypothetical protein
MFNLWLALYQVRPWHCARLVQGATYVRSRAERTRHLSFTDELSSGQGDRVSQVDSNRFGLPLLLFSGALELVKIQTRTLNLSSPLTPRRPEGQNSQGP